MIYYLFIYRLKKLKLLDWESQSKHIEAIGYLSPVLEAQLAFDHGTNWPVLYAMHMDKYIDIDQSRIKLVISLLYS